MTVIIASILDVLSSARERSEAVRAARVPREPGALHPSKCLFPDGKPREAGSPGVPLTPPRNIVLAENVFTHR